MDSSETAAANTLPAEEAVSVRLWWQRVPVRAWGLAAVVFLTLGVLVALCGPVWVRRSNLERLAALPDITFFDAIELETTGRAEGLTFPADDPLERLFGQNTWTARQYEILLGKQFPRDRLPLLAGVQTVRSLTLMGSGFRDADLQGVRRLPGLRSLRLYAPEITPAGLRNLTGSGVTQLALCDPGYGPEHVAAAVQALPQLTAIDLQQTGAGDDWLVPLRGHPHLRDVNLWKTDVTDAGVAILGTLPQLDWVALPDDRITETGWKSLPPRFRPRR